MAPTRNRTCGALPDRRLPDRRSASLPCGRRRPPELPLPAPLDRRDAFRVLQLPPAADEREVKRAYRRLVRTHHPDVGGEPAIFHELQQAYDLLIGDGAAAPRPVPQGRPSRPREAWSSGVDGPAREEVDLDTVRWDLPLPTDTDRLSRDLVARWLASGDDRPVRPLAATSRAPGSRLNRAAPKLSPDLTTSLEIGPDTDDRGHEVVATRLVAGNRRARRVLDEVGLDGGWVRRRGTASTSLTRAATPDEDRRTTALRTTDAVVALLDRVAWPLDSWILTTPGGEPDGPA